MTEYGSNPLTGERVLIVHDRPTPSSFWSYQPGSATPSWQEAVDCGAIKADKIDDAAWQRLTPGMRREIVRSWQRINAKLTGECIALFAKAG